MRCLPWSAFGWWLQLAGQRRSGHTLVVVDPEVVGEEAVLDDEVDAVGERIEAAAIRANAAGVQPVTIPDLDSLSPGREWIPSHLMLKLNEVQHNLRRN